MERTCRLAWQSMVTRFLDITFSLAAMVLLSPVLVSVYVLCKLTGPHQAFFVQQRVGKGGKEFGVFKFVTMVEGAERMPGGDLVQKEDPRVLPLGRFLRRTKINELPQLFNIFLGQMSLVGPRPQAKAHYDLYAPEVKAAIESVLPGLTGIGSIVFRDEESILDDVDGDGGNFHDTVIVPYKGSLELWYCRTRSLKLYFLLLLVTMWTLVRPGTAIWLRLFPDLPRVPASLQVSLKACLPGQEGA